VSGTFISARGALRLRAPVNSCALRRDLAVAGRADATSGGGHPLALGPQALLIRELVGDVAAAPGTGFLQIVRRGERSVVGRAFAASPLKLLTPKNHGTAAWVYSATYGGGLVGGDAIDLAVDVAPRAAAFISTQSSTKAYRSAQGTSTRLDALVGDGGLLVVSPDPTVCFAGSTYRQAQHVELSGTGALVLVDCLSSGRRAAGERWAFDRYSSRTSVRVDGRLIFYDGLSLDSVDGDVAERMGRFDALATVLILGTSLASSADSVMTRVRAIPLVRCPDVLTSAGPVAGQGVVLRIAGTSGERVARLVREHLGFVPALLGDDPWSRKW
jgi:urease accessory protein